MDFRSLIQGAIETAQQCVGEPATYTRGVHSLSVTLLPGQAGFNADPSRRLIISSDEHDWQMPIDQLVINGQQTVPQRGDRISIVRNGATFVYEVMPRSGEQEYRLDPTATLLRIHTKLRAKS